MRQNIKEFMISTIEAHSGCTILEIGPKAFEPHAILRSTSNIIETVDIIPNEKTTYVQDLTESCEKIPNNRFDAVYCLEVIEHCSDPLALLSNIKRKLKKDGRLYLSWPFQFRLHGPLPDAFRISEYGMKILLEKAGLTLISMTAFIDDERPAFPISYTAICTH